MSLLLDVDARATAGLVPVVFVVPSGSFLDRLLDRTGLSATLTLAADPGAARDTVTADTADAHREPDRTE